jgi:hypothetical protein
MPVPDAMVRALETRRLEIANGKFTAQMLRGNLRGKPRGSVETADKAKLRQDFGQSLQGLMMLAKMFPAVQFIFQNPEAAEAVIEQWARLFNVPDRQPFVNGLRKAIEAQQQAAHQQQMLMGGGVPMGAPAGPGNIVQALPPQLQQLLMAGQAGGVQ